MKIDLTNPGGWRAHILAAKYGIDIETAKQMKAGKIEEPESVVDADIDVPTETTELES